MKSLFPLLLFIVSFAVLAEGQCPPQELALKECESLEGGQQCRIIYSACSMSEFKPDR